MDASFDMRQLEAYEEELLRLANYTMPAESKKFLKKNAKKLVKITKNTAKSIVGKKTGNYLEGFKPGKVYRYNGDLSCRAFNSSPHAHLIEYGHVQETANGEKFVEGMEVFKKSAEMYQDVYYEEIEQFIDDMLEKGLAR